MDWDVALQKLRREFVGDAPARFHRLSGVIDQLRHDPADASALADLHREFHTLAGSGATYGFPEVTRLAGRVEDESAALLDGGVPSAGDLERWSAAVTTLRAHVLAADPDGR